MVADGQRVDAGHCSTFNSLGASKWPESVKAIGSNGKPPHRSTA